MRWLIMFLFVQTCLLIALFSRFETRWQSLHDILDRRNRLRELSGRLAQPEYFVQSEKELSLSSKQSQEVVSIEKEYRLKIQANKLELKKAEAILVTFMDKRIDEENLEKLQQLFRALSEYQNRERQLFFEGMVALRRVLSDSQFEVFSRGFKEP